jgi:hypothetical protein
MADLLKSLIMLFIHHISFPVTECQRSIWVPACDFNNTGEASDDVFKRCCVLRIDKH